MKTLTNITLASFACLTLIFVIQQAFAADLNGYTAKYEISLTTPTPKGTVSCSGQSNENPNASNEFIIRDNRGWDQINHLKYQKYFVCPGDYRNRGKITLLRGGSGPSNRRWIVLWYPGINTNGHPGRAKSSSFDKIKPIPSNYQAKIQEFAMNGGDWLVIDRITIVPYGQKGIDFVKGGISNDVVINRVLIEADKTGPSTSSNYAIKVRDSDRVTIQNSVVRNCAKHVNKDSYGVHISSYTKNVHLVNNEIYNCGQAYQIGDKDAGEGFVAENNDLYVTPEIYMRCGAQNGITSGRTFSDVGDTRGACMCAESIVAHKSGSINPNNPALVIHNRMWGSREQGWAWNGSRMTRECGGSGLYLGLAFSTSYYSRNINIERNIIFDSEVGLRSGIDTHSTLTTPSKHFNNTFRSNLIFNIRDFGGDQITAALQFYRGSKFEVSYNTITNSDIWIRGNRDHEVACNLIVNGGIVNATGDLIQATQNAYVNTSQNLGETRKAVYDKQKAKLQPYSFYRKLWTNPEKLAVSDARPAVNSPIAGYCSSYLNNQAYGAKIAD